VSSQRIGILFGGIAVIFCALLARLFQLQLASDSDLPSPTTPERTIILPAARGAIFDRDSRLLRGTRDAFDVHVTASVFREKNLVDALADLFVLLGPPPAARTPIERSRLVVELRGAHPIAAVDRVLGLDAAAALSSDADDLHGRARVLVEPEGTLVRPSSHARRRVLEALAVVAGEKGGRPREIRRRLKAGLATVGSVAAASAADLADRIRHEEGLLSRLGAELGLGDAGEVRSALDERCDRHFRRVEAEVERRVDDAICLQHFGSWSLDRASLGDEGIAELRLRAAAAIRDSGRARAAVSASRAILGGRLPGPVPASQAESDAAGDVELARAAGIADWDPATIRAALCGQVRGEPAFERSRYMDARKESQTRNELAAFRNDELGAGGTFALAEIVDGLGGLRALGFELAPSFARDDARRQSGANLALLLGEVTRRNTPATDGVEQKLDDLLRGEPGEARIDADGRVASLKPPRHGRNLTLTLSLPLQQRIEAILGRVGAIAVVDVRTGGILATSTWPFPRDDEVRSAFAELVDYKARQVELRQKAQEGDETARARLVSVCEKIRDTAAIHRGVTSVTNVPPGSVMKALTLLAGLEAGAVHPAFEIECTTGPGDGPFGCHHHGRIDLQGAIERSCNEYCYQTAGLLGGAGPLFALYEKVALFDEVPGLIGPRDGAWMRRAIANDDPKNLAIGQGSLSLPPVRLAAVAASLATGRVTRAHLHAPEGFNPVGPPFAQQENLALIRSGMRRVAVGDEGTARRHKRLLEPLGIAGKTGTAQLRSGDEEIYQAWFVGYAPHTAPKYAFAVLLERTSDEGSEAAPIAARVIEACYDVLGGRP
jgi:cell division protein FtsI/penicillin-binding protein 2